MKIGTWNGYNVNLIKDDSMVDNILWTITDKKGKEQNRFESKASFGQFVFRTGFKANTTLKKSKKLVFVIKGGKK